MDPEKRARRQNVRLIVSEAVMVVAVVAMVVVLGFLVSGYWLSSDFKVERQGMLQISSVPTGATVAVDGEAPWYQRTNASKVLSTGEHTISLTKDGYDSWSRTVNIREGLLYRVNYPRLFLLEREKEAVYNDSELATTLATVSPDHKWMLLINNTTTWQLINLSNEKIEPKKISVARLFDAVSLADGATTGLFTGKIVSANWSGDNDHILIQSQADGVVEWVVLNVRNIAESVNITREFATSFDGVRIFDNSASVLLVMKGGNLHKIDVSARQISAVLVEKVQSYNVFGSEIIFTASKESLYYTGIIKINDPTEVNIIVSPSEKSVKAYISRFYDEKYITIIDKNAISVYKYDGMEVFFEGDLTFQACRVKVSADGGFVFMNDGGSIITLDMEALELREWTLESDGYGWLDGHTVYTVNGGVLTVYDFDGLNRREISKNVSASFPITITDNKWLYYFSDGKLVREKITD